ncbi:hypothetical protein SH139x_005745 [Planctomycetaceae bacterium SH139]
MSSTILNSTVCALMLIAVTQSSGYSDDKLARETNGYRVAITSRWHISAQDAVDDADQQLCLIVQPLLGFDVASAETIMRAHQIRRSLNSVTEHIESNERAYGVIYQSTLSGTIFDHEIDAIRESATLRKHRVRWQWLNTAFTAATSLVASMLIFIKLDQATAGDCRVLMCIAMAGCGFCVFAMILGIIW